MRVGEAYRKCLDELTSEARRRAGIEPGDGVMTDADSYIRLQSQIQRSAQAGDFMDALSYGGSLKDFVSQRAETAAAEIISQGEQRGLDYSDIEEAFKVLTEDLPEQVRPAMLKMFAMGYSFGAPEYASVPRDKDGFLKLCREVDRDLIAIQVSMFSADGQLLELFSGRVELAGLYVTHVFSVTNKPLTKFALRDWFYQVFATVTFDSFVAGQKVRELLEQEAAFESMMKEND